MLSNYNYNWTSWNEIDESLRSASNNEKGNVFELLSKYYFLYSFQFQNYYDEVWLGNEIPQKVLDILGLPKQDLGIDIIAKYGDEYHAIQCKYHGDTSKSVTLNELSTFLSLYASSPLLTQGFVCSTADTISPNLNKVKTKPLNYILIDTWQGLSEEFFNTINESENNKNYKPEPYVPRPHQRNAVQSATQYFKNETRGKLIFPCGSGKSLTGYWITEALASKRTLVAVPSLSLIKQTLEVYLREVIANDKKVKWLCICSDEGIGKDDDILYKTNNIGIPCYTDVGYISDWLNKNRDEEIIVFTTYQSGKIIADISTEQNLSFDVGIFDEAHKTVGSSKKLFSHLLTDTNISIRNRIFMTATQRFYSGSNDDIMSMDDNSIYGDIFAEMSFKEAIETTPQLLTDYKVVTIEVTKNEIAAFIKENQLVSIDSRWAKETESRSLASMIALRKAMNRLPIHNAVSFHSSIAKAVSCKELQPYIDKKYGFNPIDTYTVSGKIPTSKRNKIVNEFANSSQALITNSKCLTEGVDVPKIDCIVFSDPRKSQVDIVQALGRALRVKQGKEFGYVIIPIIYNEETQEIDNENFSEIISVVQALSTNDRRIIDYFKMASEGNKSQNFISKDLFEVLCDYITEEEILNKIEIKIWDKLSKVEWLPFEEARDFVRALNFKRREDYTNYSISGQRPKDIPSTPRKTYKYKGWVSWGDWLGTGTIANQNRSFVPFEEARDLVRTLNLKRREDYLNYAKSGEIPDYIPYLPSRSYKNKGWISWSDWLGTNNIAPKDRIFIPYEVAQDYVRTLNLKGKADYLNSAKSGKIPNYIPSSPSKSYKNKGWVSWGDWIGTGTIANQNKSFLPFEEARDYVRTLNLKVKEDYLNYVKSVKITKDIPSDPSQFYKMNGWISWGDWLGTGTIANQNKSFLPFEEARKIVRKLNLRSAPEWYKYHKNGLLPSNIPTNPRRKYKDKGWKGYKDWLGTDV